MNKKVFKNIEWWILISAIILCVVGCVALYSATQSDDYGYFKKQLIWIAVSLIIMIIVTFIDYEILVKLSPIFYGISIVLLIAVLFTKSINGASSWFNIGGFSLQPGEISKVAVVLFLAYVITNIQKRGKEEINKISKLLIILGALAIPVLLIVMQPDFGTAMAYVLAFIMILFVAGIDKKYLIAAGIIIIIGMPLAYKFVLPNHVKTRIDVFLNPESDPKGSGYNIIQSKLAIGAGELTGMGLLNGNQTQLGYLSPKTTDFIFSLIGEEMGFIVSGSVIVIYVFMITKALYVAKTAKDDEGTYIAAGISGILFFHMTENIGMTMGLLPITGVPLLFVSYGGSAMITSFICIGLLLNISGNRKRTIFVK
ncbi:MAG: rod shape-determining protein RodA [Clostridia bacterium]|nr:rod shape-determining protein RodA [Clostridia bacterium]